MTICTSFAGCPPPAGGWVVAGPAVGGPDVTAAGDDETADDGGDDVAHPASTATVISPTRSPYGRKDLREMWGIGRVFPHLV
jgi:hypothetical protein